jgi:5-(carboxyamino)imidazole ribonucleotide synthase
MLILAGKPLGLDFCVLDRDDTAPAAGLADHFIPGGLYDAEALARLTAFADITTFEIEHADTDALSALERAGATLRPSSSLLALINDKLAQKNALTAGKVPVPAYWNEHPGTYPVVQKLRRGGYDGRGVAILEGPGDAALDGESYYEEKVPLAAELAALVARAPSGETATFPIVDMEFHPGANLVRQVVIPARVPPEVQSRATEIARHAVGVLGGVGLHAVELFWTSQDEILVNEIAPRPHNSGHLTIEACETSQYEQHLRAICDLPLGSTELRSPAVSLNLVGAKAASGRPDVSPLHGLLAHPGLHLHWYDKAEVRPFRKMGHITLTGDDQQALVRAAESLNHQVWIGGSAE